MPKTATSTPGSRRSYICILLLTFFITTFSSIFIQKSVDHWVKLPSLVVLFSLSLSLQYPCLASVTFHERLISKRTAFAFCLYGVPYMERSISCGVFMRALYDFVRFGIEDRKKIDLFRSINTYRGKSCA